MALRADRVERAFSGFDRRLGGASVVFFAPAIFRIASRMPCATVTHAVGRELHRSTGLSPRGKTSIFLRGVSRHIESDRMTGITSAVPSLCLLSARLNSTVQMYFDAKKCVDTRRMMMSASSSSSFTRWSHFSPAVTFRISQPLMSLLYFSRLRLASNSSMYLSSLEE
jgi:hypothetical protein